MVMLGACGGGSPSIGPPVGGVTTPVIPVETDELSTVGVVGSIEEVGPTLGAVLVPVEAGFWGVVGVVDGDVTEIVEEGGGGKLWICVLVVELGVIPLV